MGFVVANLALASLPDYRANKGNRDRWLVLLPRDARAFCFGTGGNVDNVSGDNPCLPDFQAEIEYHKGEPCPYKSIICAEGYCRDCWIYKNQD